MYVRIDELIIKVCEGAYAHTAVENVQTTSGILSDVVFAILKPFPTEIEQTETSLVDQLNVIQLFKIMHFYFQSGNALKWLPWGKKLSKYHFFTPGDQNMKLKKKCIKYKCSYMSSHISFILFTFF